MSSDDHVYSEVLEVEALESEPTQKAFRIRMEELVFKTPPVSVITSGWPRVGDKLLVDFGTGWVWVFRNGFREGGFKISKGDIILR